MSHKDSAEISPANFPNLRSFLRGYFHQDLADEYGTPQEAAETFCEDADTDERLAVAREWIRFMELMKGRASSDINRLLAAKLGSGVQLTDEDLEQVAATFERYLHPRTRHHNHEEDE
jgi:hypothetical protein